MGAQSGKARVYAAKDDSSSALWREARSANAAATREQLRRGAARRSDRGANPFQQPLQKSDKRGRRGGCDDLNTSQ